MAGRRGQTVVDGIPPNGNPYTQVVDAAPVEGGFGDIVWQAELKLPWALDECDRLDATLPNPPRRKRLSKKVLGPI